VFSEVLAKDAEAALTPQQLTGMPRDPAKALFEVRVGPKLVRRACIAN
jgi:hypothetical protein